MSITSGDKVFYYMVRDSLCFLTMTEARYPKRLAFLYLDEVGDLVLQELVREFGNNVSTTDGGVVLLPVCALLMTIFLSYCTQWRVEVDQTARPFRFIHYDPIIQRKQKEFQDERQQRSKLNNDLSEIQSIMKKNITDILDRGEKLDNVQNISQELMSKSSNFKWGTRKLTWQARMQQYMPIIVIVLIVCFIIYVKFFW
jgi:vesicle transport protein SEC22